MEKEKVKQKIEIEKIAKKYHLSLVLMFGSCITGKTHPNSDLDIAVMPKEEIEYSSLLFDLQKTFPEKEVDIVFLNRADPLLLKKVLENCKMLYGTKQKLALLKIYAFKKYCDYKKYFDLEKKFVHKFLHSL